ncbi:hypothetical protein OTERR_02870 [Oryzomicrobium terrae]|uniref:Uncharacterized protein n=1 Tax=Oryzomicrobium terrae TaxID=1735038 RepID=A0A5C1E4I3_9RHOO|nr:LysE family transporter [Oryzomicrobium terrae]QEL63763.1 hypothetical protein OTERR_02870 [Oryzomicrobium terrae]
MDGLSAFATLTAVHLLAAATPGPDFAMVIRQSLLAGRRAGLLTSLGIALGLSVHIAYSAAGLAALIAHSATWLTAFKLAGGAYLLYLGWKGLRARPTATTDASDGAPDSAPVHESALRHLVRGFLTNALNPKAPLYFLALFTLVLSPATPLPRLAAYGVWLMALQFAWFSLVTLFFTQPRVRAAFLGCGHWLERAFGAALAVLGLRLLLSTER